MIKPVDPFEGGGLDGLEMSPWSVPTDHFGFEETDHRFGQGVEAPMCQECWLGGGSHGMASPMIGEEPVVDLTRHEPLQAADEC
jgi:hypothetical protein